MYDIKLHEENAIDGYFSKKQLEILKNSICKGISQEEFEIFLMACAKTKLDPFMRQIYAVKRKCKKPDGTWGEVMSIQTGIDGYRLIAKRTGCYAPGPEPTYNYDDQGKLISATAYIKLMTADGTWHQVSASAYYDEYCQRTREGQPMGMWATMPRTMLAKCFDEETEVLTEFGFRKFKDVTGKIMQVTDSGLEAVEAKPFSQEYDGDMVAFHGQDLDFCVTPNHEMITTSGVLPASEMYDQCKSSLSYFIPRIAPADNSLGLGFTQEQCELAAACLCDGDYMSSNKFRIKVSRPHKIEKIRSWNLHIRETVRNLAGKSTTHSSGRTITTKNDQIEFTFSIDSVSPLVIPYKRLSHEMMLKMNSQEAKWFVDAWAFFDGNANSGGGEGRTLRIWTSDLQYLGWLELLGSKAGYSISPTRSRISDIGSKPNFVISFSEHNEKGISKHNRGRGDPSLVIEKNTSGKVWCVTVPSGKIVVKRLSYSMLCKNCAEAQALRKAFPSEMSGIYTKEEMQQAEIEIVKADLHQIAELEIILDHCDPTYKTWVINCLDKQYNIKYLTDIPIELYDRVRSSAAKNMEDYQNKISQHRIEDLDARDATGSTSRIT